MEESSSSDEDDSAPEAMSSNTTGDTARGAKAKRRSRGSSSSSSSNDDDSSDSGDEMEDDADGGSFGKRKADDFLRRQELAMDPRFKATVVLPGDDVTESTTRTTRSIKLGPGLVQHAQDKVLATRAGVLRYRPPCSYWVESNGRRYSARVEDQVLGVVEDRMGESYKVNIFGRCEFPRERRVGGPVCLLVAGGVVGGVDPTRRCPPVWSGEAGRRARRSGGLSEASSPCCVGRSIDRSILLIAPADRADQSRVTPCCPRGT